MILKTLNNVLQKTTGRRLVCPSISNNNQKKTLMDLVEIRDSFIKDSNFTSLEKNFILFATKNLHLSNAQLLQDLWVAWELDEKKNGYFVEFGAYDGISLSNTAMLEREYAWAGLLAEPNDDRHAAITASRTAILDKRCVYSESNLSLVFNVTDRPEYSTINDFSEMDLHSEIRRNSRQISVETVTLAELLNQNNAPEIIDYLSIDTEGSEFDILQAYDWKHPIRCISVEHNYTENQSKIDHLLRSKGYIKRLENFSLFDGWYISNNSIIDR